VTSLNSLSSVSLLEEWHRVPGHTKSHLPVSVALESGLQPRTQGFGSSLDTLDRNWHGGIL